MRLKKGGPGRNSNRRHHQLDSTGHEEEIIPLFERDVNELETEVDLPDETLLTDHLASGDKEASSFDRLKPLRFSVGRKLRNRVDTPPASTADGYVISNHNADICQQPQELAHQTRSPTPISSPICMSPVPTPIPHMTSPELTVSQLQDLRSLTTSPVPVSDNTFAVQSHSRLSVRSPDSMVSTMSGLSQRGRGRTVDMGVKHPLSRCARAYNRGSSLTTVTSEFADRRQQFKATMKKRAGSAGCLVDDNTPTTSPTPQLPEEHQITLVLPATESLQRDKKPTPLPQNIPTIKHETMSDLAAATEDATELPSPICSPPDSPAAHLGVNRRESGYMSSTCDPLEDAYASDEGENEVRVCHHTTPGNIIQAERCVTIIS